MSGHELLLNIAGGVALLLWATRMVRTGVMRAFGADLRRHLGRSTQNRLGAFAMGAAIASLLQSSTATALLAVSFAGRGLITVAAGLAIMLGADVGSTLVVQVLSFDISWLAPAFLLVGVIAFSGFSSPLWHHTGRVLIGLGLLLLSLGMIVGASEPLRDSEALRSVVVPLSSDPILALLLAAVLAWLAHSSVALVLLIMSLTLVGVVPTTLGFALVLGANIGSGIIPVALTFSDNRTARRIPLGNLLIRLAGAIALLPLIGALAPLLAAIEADPARQIANFHTAFNLALAAIFLPLSAAAAKLTEKILPETGEDQGRIAAKYLDPTAVSSPPVALACATREVLRMADLVETMLRGVIDVFRSDDLPRLEKLVRMDDDVDELHEAIKLYLTEASRQQLEAQDSVRSVELITFTTNLEHIGDIIDKNLLELARKKIKHRLTFFRGGLARADRHARARGAPDATGDRVFVSRDLPMARRLLADKERFRDLEMDGSERHLARLRSGQIQSIETSALHLDMLRDFKRINSHLTSVAYPILDAKGELRRSRLKVRPEDEAADTEADASDLRSDTAAGKPL